jgi:hypothetical protein
VCVYVCVCVCVCIDHSIGTQLRGSCEWSPNSTCVCVFVCVCVCVCVWTHRLDLSSSLIRIRDVCMLIVRLPFLSIISLLSLRVCVRPYSIPRDVSPRQDVQCVCQILLTSLKLCVCHLAITTRFTCQLSATTHCYYSLLLFTATNHCYCSLLLLTATVHY